MYCFPSPGFYHAIPEVRRMPPVDNSATNLFANVPSALPEELMETLLQSATIHIERIVSHGHASPQEFWYDQPENEWVVVLRGAARLRFEDKVIELKPGDYVDIPAHKKHRVEWTMPEEATVWLAVHYQS
jgi:cupin 2 domain-containing protein